jgi:uncharacterized protein (DUF302 family)
VQSLRAYTRRRESNCSRRSTTAAKRKGRVRNESDQVVDFGSLRPARRSCLLPPARAIDLPLKIVVREDEDGKVWVSYNSPSYLKERHGLIQELFPNIAIIETLASKIAQ